MQNKLFPSTIADYTAENILSKDSAKGHFIYRIVVLFVIAVFLLLPILKVTVSVQSNGIIRPLTEKNEIKLLISGTVSEVFVEENQHIDKHQPILKIDTSVADEKLNLIQYEENEQQLLLHDLKLLTNNNPKFDIHINKFKTIHYKSEYLLLKNRLKENSFQQDKAAKELERYELLKKNKLTSESDFEDKELELSKLKIQCNMLIEENIANWNKAYLACRLKLKQLETDREQMEKEKELCIIKSPTAGTLEQFSGISTGSYIQSGQLIAVISPDDDLQVEVYVHPQDIGLINLGTKARIQVDAFNYNQWGLVTGNIIEISDDYLSIQNQPFFRVRVSLDQSFLTLKNGYKGYLKKGMTVRSRFTITRRSLFQLLYDKADDWLNPMQKSA